MNHRLVYVTVPSMTLARSLAQRLVSERAVACVNIVNNITSIYRWEGAVEEAAELLLIAKTVDSKLEHIKRIVKEEHSYAVPEIIAVNITDGSEAYLKWISESVKT